MPTYVLYRSESSSSFTFVQSDGPQALMESDSEEIWRVDASSWDIACLKRNQFLSWEPYKPQISTDADLLALLPRSKHDFDNTQLLINLGFPTIKPVLPQLLEWLQDINWPIARTIVPFLAGLGSRCRTEVQTVLRSNDGVWKYWIISTLINRMDDSEALTFVPDLRNLLANPTAADRENEVDIAAQTILRKLNTS